MKKDLIIIGAGPGGYEVAIKAGNLGLDVLLIDKEEVGGTCLNWGCIPTKALYRNAEILKDLKHSETFGINLSDYNVDFNKVQERKNQVKQTLIDGIKFMIKKANVELIYGEAKFINNTEILVNEKTYTATNIIIATGSKDTLPPIEGINSENVITSKGMLEVDEIPENLVIIGGGVIGVEMGSIFNEFGSNVSIIEYMDNLLPMLDSDISKRFKPLLKKAGINSETSAKVTKIEKDNQGLIVTYEQKGKEKQIFANKVLVATGRKVYYDNLGLENTDVQFDNKGIKVDDDYKTTVDNIYAVGDVIGKIMLAHTATYQSYYVLDKILANKNTTNFNINPSCVFTFPEIATVGLTEKEAIDKYTDDIHTNKFMYKANGKALAMDETDGFVKIVTHKNIVIGVHILGYSASTLIHEAAMIIHNKMNKDEAAMVIHAHPTLSEILMEALKH